MQPKNCFVLLKVDVSHFLTTIVICSVSLDSALLFSVIKLGLQCSFHPFFVVLYRYNGSSTEKALNHLIDMDLK